MKKTIFAFILSFVCFTASISAKELIQIYSDKTLLERADANESAQIDGNAFFSKFANAKGVTVVYISKDMLSMMPKMNMPGPNIGSLASKLDGLEIYSVEDKGSLKSIKADINKLLGDNTYKTAMLIKEGEDKTGFYLKKGQNNKNELLMVAEEAGEINIIRFFGTFTLEDIQNLTNKNAK